MSTPKERFLSPVWDRLPPLEFSDPAALLEQHASLLPAASTRAEKLRFLRELRNAFEEQARSFQALAVNMTILARELETKGVLAIPKTRVLPQSE